MERKLKTLIVITLFFICARLGPTFAQTSQNIEAIKKLYQQTNERIALSEQSPDASTTFLIELEVNKNLSPYPAVGIYKTVASFYYTFGDREKNPYPDRLLKILLSTDRSDRKEHSEFLFDEAGRLIFYFEKKGGIERRMYLAAERPIRVQEGERVLRPGAKPQVELLATVLKEKANLIAIFRRSLEF